MSTWCDEALDTQALRVREAIAELSSALNSIEGSVLLTQEVNNEQGDDQDQDMAQKVVLFRRYLGRLRGDVNMMRQIPAFNSASSQSLSLSKPGCSQRSKNGHSKTQS